MTIAFLLALALTGAEPQADAAAPPSSGATADAPIAASPDAPRKEPPAPVIQEKAATRENMEDAIPDGAPKDDYGFVAWCHGALSGQVELDPIVEKDMDAIEGKAKAAKRHAGDLEIAKEHKRYLQLYERALSAAEKASPVAIHQRGVDAEVDGYKIWGPTRNKAPIWRMVDWGNWEVPPRCEKSAKRLYDRATLFGEALTSETTPPEAAPSGAAPSGAALSGAPPGVTPVAAVTTAPSVAVPAADTPPAAAPPPVVATEAADKAKAATEERKAIVDGLRGPQ